MRAILATTLVFVVAWVPSADARRAPTKTEAAAIAKAVKTSSLTRAVPASRYDVRNIRISTVDSSFAAGDVIPKPAFHGSVQQSVVLLHRRNHRWVLVDIGGAMGCPGASKAVLRDLRVRLCG
jgi:hypothetical protein